MKKIQHIFNTTSDITILLGYVFYVLNNVLSQTELNTFYDTDGSIKTLIDVTEQHKYHISTITSTELWETVTECLKASRHNKQEGVIFPYIGLSKNQLRTIIIAQEAQLSLPMAISFPFATLFNEIPIKDSTHRIIIGYEIPMITHYLADGGEIDVIVFDSTEYAVAKIHAEILYRENIRVHKIQSESQLEPLLDQANVTVVVNTLASDDRLSPFLNMFNEPATSEFDDGKLPSTWLVLHILMHRFHHTNILALIDEKELRHRRYMNFRVALVKAKLVDFVVSVRGEKHFNFNFIAVKPTSQPIVMKAIEYDKQHFLVQTEMIDEAIINKIHFSILTPFDYTSLMLLDNTVDLASIAQIFSGYQVGLSKIKAMEESDNHVEVSMVSMPHLNKFEVITPNDEYIIQVGKNVLKRFEIRENDILIAAKSNDPKPTIVKNKPHDHLWIANASLIVIRVKPHASITAEYVFAFLSSDRGLSQLKRLQRGNIVFITTKQISEVFIETLNQEECDRVTQSVRELLSVHHQLSKEISRIVLQFERILL